LLESKKSAGEMGHRIAKHIYASDLGYMLEKSIYYILDAQGNVMSVYERKIEEEESVSYNQTEKYIYGSSRLGVHTEVVPVLASLYIAYDMDDVTHEIGYRNYELTNHLGNVLSVVSDKVISHDNSGTVDYWLADIRQSTDYSPFGVLLAKRDLRLTDPVTSNPIARGRFGFNGMEMDDELKLDGNSYDFGARFLDPRLGRWLTIDPLTKKFPSHSPYCFTINNPILYVDPDGNDVGFGNRIQNSVEVTTGFKLANTSSIFNSLLLNFASSKSGDLKGETDGVLSRHQLNFEIEGIQDWGETFVYYKNTKGKWEKYDGKVQVDEKTEFKIDIAVTYMGMVDDFSIGSYAETFLHEILVHAEEFTNALLEFESEMSAANGDETKMESARKTLNENLANWSKNNDKEGETNSSPSHKQMKAGVTNLEAAANEIIAILEKQLEAPDLDKKTRKTISKEVEGIKYELAKDLRPTIEKKQ
jgi:RHS repeat-associated protein